MADQAQLQLIIDQLNQALADVTPYKLAVVPPGEIQPVEKNAHYMPKRVYDTLMENVKHDKNLSSLPFCWRKPSGEFVALSGNHRTKVASEAGVPLVMVLYTDKELSRAEQVSIQLSHNALVGHDNPTVLGELWREIDTLQMKVYSGLDEEIIKAIDETKVIRINEAPLKLEELRLLFLPSEIDRIEEIIKRVGGANKRRFAARVEDFDRFFEALLNFKEAAGIVNTGTAIMAIIEIVEDWLAKRTEAQDVNS